MKMLVTGGSGFIGSNFIRYWMQHNPDDKIVNIDLLTYAGNADNLTDLANNPNYTFVHGDICDAKLVNTLVQGIDLIVHFAAESHVDRSILNSGAFIKTNVEGTRVLLEAAKDNSNIRFHHVSTDEVFGSLALDEEAFNEESKYDPRSPYSASKAASDHLVRAYFHTYGLPITISNCSNNYGPYQYPEKLIPLFITNLLEGKKVPVYGEGKNVRDWIHVDDHNYGLELIIKKGRIGETYCLGGGSERTNLQVTRLILDMMEQGEEMTDWVKDRPGHDLRYAINFDKAKRELGFKPSISFEAGLNDVIDWYKANESWWKKLKEIKK